MTRNCVFILGACALVLGCDHRSTNGAPSSPEVTTRTTSSSAPSAALAAGSSNSTLANAAWPSNLLAVGSEVPDVSAVAQDGEVVKLRALQGKPLIVYFYPKDDTPGCTIEAKGIRDRYQELAQRATVLGVSSDTQDSHKAFADKYSLPFKLLVDSSHTLERAFGVPLRGDYAKRVTFVIDRAGKVRKVFPDVNPNGHAQELLAALAALG